MLPTPCSYWRVQDGISSGSPYACWGADNKESLICVCGEKGSHQRSPMRRRLAAGGDNFIAKYVSVNESLEEFMTMPTEEEVVRHLVEYF